MLDVQEIPVDYIYKIIDCRSLNRMEMIGFICCDIMGKSHNESTMQHFRNLFRGITKGPWTISCDPGNNSVRYITGDYVVEFTPIDSDGIAIEYYYGMFNYNFYTSIWNIDDVEDALV